MKIVLLGANGQLGTALGPQLDRLGPTVRATRDGKTADGLACEAGDLANAIGLVELLDRLGPDVIVNAAAYTAVDRAEDDEAVATIVNGDAVGVLAAWAAAHDCLLVHYSTDYIFDGTNSVPYVEDTPPSPVNAYGRSKLVGEQALVASGATYLLLRTAWVYAAHGANFFRTMLRLGARGAPVRVVDDQIGTPTSVNLIASATARAIDATQRNQTLAGTYHLTASGQTSWFGFASRIYSRDAYRRLQGSPPPAEPIGTNEFPTRARRPAYSVLDNRRFVQAFGTPLPNWKDDLDGVLRTAEAIAHVHASSR